MEFSSIFHEEVIYINEGDNLDITKGYISFKKDISGNIKACKKNIRNKNFKEASKNLSEIENKLNSFEKEIEVLSKETTKLETVIGISIWFVKSFGELLTLTYMLPGIGTIIDLFRQIKKGIKAHKANSGEKNLYIKEIRWKVSKYKEVIKKLKSKLSNAKALEKEMKEAEEKAKEAAKKSNDDFGDFDLSWDDDEFNLDDW